MTERRYSEEEARAIFEQAAEAQASGPGPHEGRTLGELQAIGAEVGLPPELLARAARSLDLGEQVTRESFLGLPLGVGRKVELGRQVSEEEWEHLVADLRATFGATGRVRTRGSVRQWSNGNLRATLERTATGDRFRIRTLKGDARGLMHGGLALLTLAAALFLAFLLSGEAVAAGGQPVLLGLLGAALFGAGALQLPRWSARRLEQMEGVVERLLLPPRTDR